LRCLATAAFTLLVLVTVAGESPATAADPSFQVIVHPEVEGSQIPRTVLSSIFLKEAARWGDGRPVAPVDQSLRSPVRATFSEYVLNKPVDGIPALWHRKMIQGVTPPIVKSSDEEVIAYVAKTKGSIGYVSLSARLPTTVRAVSIVD
jgi:ABC-type phosphate transport system substrate-binding protein